MKNVILINGAARSGKDTVARMMKDFLKSNNQTVEILSFAEPLKQIIASTFNISLEDLEEFKNKSDRYEVHRVDTHSFILHQKTNFRKILQRFGTEGMKPVFGENIWARLLAEKANKSSSNWIIVPDFRFNIEYEEMLKFQALEVYNVYAFEVLSDRGEIKESTHSSERELDDFEFDYTIDNIWGKLNETKEQIKHIFKDVFKV